MQASWSHRRELESTPRLQHTFAAVHHLFAQWRGLERSSLSESLPHQARAALSRSLVPEDTKVVWLAILPVSVGPSMTLLQIVRQGLALRAAEGHQCQRPAA